MSAQAEIRRVYKFVEEGNRALNSDREEEDSYLMREAARSGISTVAETRGWPHETFD